MDATSLFYAAIVGATSFLLLECVARAFMRGVARIFRGKSHRTVAMLIALFVAAVILGGEKVGDRGGPGGPRRPAPALRQASPAARSSVMRGSTDRILASLRRGDTDTDGDGIPDWWEIRTFGDPGVADSSLDRDGDGLTDLEEYGLRTDPRTRDTDADGMDDKYEILIGEDPLTPADYESDGPDLNNDGVPDEWMGVGFFLRLAFADSDGNGFDDIIDREGRVPSPSAANADVIVHITTSRSALLLPWGDDDVGIFIPPCTNFALRLRLGIEDGFNVTMRTLEGDGEVQPLWKAGLWMEWSKDRHPGATARVLPVVQGATAIDLGDDDGGLVTVAERLEPDPGGGYHAFGDDDEAGRRFARNFLEMFGKRCDFSLEVSSSSYCLTHGGGGPITATAHVTNVVGGFLWVVNDAKMYLQTNSIVVDPVGQSSVRIYCGCADPGLTSSLSAEATVSGSPCDAGVYTNITGACFTSTHNPSDASDHQPSYKCEVKRTFPNCPPRTDHNYVVGFSHINPICTRNLVRVVTGDPWDDNTDHCMVICDDFEHAINLFDLLDQSATPVFRDLSFKEDGNLISNPSSYVLTLGIQPHVVKHIEVCLKSTGETLDHLWLTLIHTSVSYAFDEWYVGAAIDLSWVDSLPRPHRRIRLELDESGNHIPVDPEPGHPNQWNAPVKISQGNYLHHNAKYAMRAPANADGHGNQACYDDYGVIITETIAGGTADYYPGEALTSLPHYFADVLPFLRATWLDGNPGKESGIGGIARPCLYEGRNCEKYLRVRPIVKP